MLYKAFLVEDEIVAREGIKNNVNWQAVGFTFCGEAPDGEMALPLIEQTCPDVLITDIKMPFMDGLELCRLVKQRLPGIKIIILSGHDEFNYAQEAVKLGVTEYLLKPIGVQDLHASLSNIAAQLAVEHAEKEKLQHLKERAEDNLDFLRQRFLLKLVLEGIPLAEAITLGRQIDLDLVAQWYLVVFLQISQPGSAEQFNYQYYRQIESAIDSLIGQNPNVILFKKDVGEQVLLLKGESAEKLTQTAQWITQQLKSHLQAPSGCGVAVGVGSCQNRLANIPQSFIDAISRLNTPPHTGALPAHPLADEAGKAALLNLDHAALENYLKFGVIQNFSAFIDSYLLPAVTIARQSYLIRNYIFIDLILATARFVHQLGGVVDKVIPEINHVETLLMNITTLEQLQQETQRIFAGAIAFRDALNTNQYGQLIEQAKAYIQTRYTNPDLALTDVAEHVNLSPSHFSTVFRNQTGQTFKEYLTHVRMEKAQTLLKTTSLKAFEIAAAVGYNDAHYFSHAFKKYTGVSPMEFR